MQFCEVQMLFIKLCNYSLDDEQKNQMTVVIDRSCHSSIWNSPITQSSHKERASHFYAAPFYLHYYFLNAPPLIHFVPIALAAGLTFPISQQARSYLRVLHRVVYPLTIHKFYFDQLYRLIFFFIETFHIKCKLYILNTIQ